MSVELTQANATFAPSAKGFFARIGEWYLRSMEVHSRAGEIEALQRKSDSELAKLGITREQIPYYVFRDKFWI